MDGTTVKKSISLETLVIKNTENLMELKAKLNTIIKTGKDYNYDISSCLKSLISSSDQEIVLLTVQAIAELSKCEEKRESYANKAFIEPIINILNKEITQDNIDLIKHSCRALGNLCCDNDAGRKEILENNGVTSLIALLRNVSNNDSEKMDEIKLFTSKTLGNFAIGGQKMCESILEAGIVDLIYDILVCELEKECMNDDIVSSVIMILSVINYNNPEYLFSPEINRSVLNVLRETSNVEISDLCLEHLQMQAEHETVKTLLATEGGVELVCSRLEKLVQRLEAGILSADGDVGSVMKQACDLVVIVLTGDEAMRHLYAEGSGPVYDCVVSWLQSSQPELLATAVLAVGNFARDDVICRRMLDEKIIDKLLDIFEKYHEISVRIQNISQDGPEEVTVTKIMHASASAIRNLCVPVANKRALAADGRAATTMLRTLPDVRDHQVAYKLLAAIRMLVDGQESVARQFLCDVEALRATAAWGARAELTGPAGEAPRLVARALPAARGSSGALLQVDGCVSCLVSMLVASHSIMQNEAILALTLLAIECFKKADTPTEGTEQKLAGQLVNAEIGKHISVLIETNCAKMPLEEASNLLTFLDLTTKNESLVQDYRQAKVHDSLVKFKGTRNDLNDNLRNDITKVVTAIVNDSG